MLFDLKHIIFMIIDLIIIVSVEILAVKLIKNQKGKDIFLIVFSVLTVLIHYSSVYVTFFTTGTARVENTMIFMIYPCNLAMWLVLIASLLKNKKGVLFKSIAEFVFYLGILGGVLGIMLNENYANNPTLTDWGILSGLLSHSTMLIACIYLLVGNYIKIRVNNIISAFLGLILMLINGLFVIGCFKLAKLQPPNVMYLLSPPLANAPWFNTWLIGILGLLVVFGITALVEQLIVPKEERWYTKLKRKKL